MRAVYQRNRGAGAGGKREGEGSCAPGRLAMKSQGPKIIAHRGASACAPENSLEAFERARQDGADGVELDVRLCGSGELVVFHDEDLRRLGKRAQRLDELSFEELRNVRLASGVRIPTLREVFEVCGPDMLVNVEIKTDHLWRPGFSRLIEAVAQGLRDVPEPARVLVSSFNPLALVASRRRMPALMHGLLFEKGGPMWARGAPLVPWLSVQAVHPQNELCTAHEVARWKGAGYAVNVWTVDDPRRIHELAALGVDGIITNDPLRARQTLG